MFFFWFMECSYEMKWSYKTFGKHLLDLISTLKQFLIKGHIPQFFCPSNNLIDQISLENVKIMLDELTKFQDSFVLTLHNVLPESNRTGHLIPLHGITSGVAKKLSEEKKLYQRAAMINLLLVCLWAHVKESTNVKINDFLHIVSACEVTKNHLGSFDTETENWSKERITSVLKALLLEVREIMTDEAAVHAMKTIFRKHITANFDRKSGDATILSIAYFIECSFKVEKEIANTLLVLHLIEFAGNRNVNYILPLFSNFLECFSERPDQRTSALQFVSLLTKEGNKCMEKKEFTQAQCMFVVALKLLINHGDGLGYVEQVSKSVMSASYYLLSKRSKVDKWIGLQGFQYCWNFLPSPDSISQQFAARLSCYYANHLWNFTLCTSTPDMRVYSENLDFVKIMLRLSVNISKSDRNIYALCYSRFLVFQGQFQKVISILTESKVKDFFNLSDEQVLEFDETDRYTVDVWLKTYINESDCVAISACVYRLYLLAICYSQLRQHDCTASCLRQMEELKMKPGQDICLSYLRGRFSMLR